MPGRVRVGSVTDFADGKLHTVDADGTSVVIGLASGDNLVWALGFAGRDMPRWSRKLIALGRKPASLTTYDVTVEGDDVYVEI